MAVIIGPVVCDLLHYHHLTSCKDSKYVDSYKKRYLDAPLSVSTEEFADSSVENGFSPRRAEIKVRKNEMKLRKNDFKVRRNSFVALWRIKDIHGGIV